ncbi:MAG: putative baseplate assembly protein, partial [Burkholderiales bacterium]|nr:putative baseplate assembly protein [Burkholderiales bacterium]
STGIEADADRSHRHVVRLTAVTPSVDPSGRLFDPTPVDAPLDVTEIEWDAQDALPFPLCLSCAAFPGLAVAEVWGNVVLADHGMTVAGEDLSRVPAPSVFRVPPVAAGGCGAPEPQPVPARYAPALAQSPLTQGFGLADRLALPLDEDRETWHAASRFAALAPADARPDIALSSTLGSQVRGWSAQLDLLAGGPDSADFVVEIDDRRATALRFGDDVNGLRPDEGTAFSATYRIGNGSAGNVGALAIAHLVSPVAGSFVAVANPLPAFGGSEPEDVDAARRDAPQAFRVQERAVTADDYARRAEQRHEVQRAAASLRWTGSWHTVFVTAERAGAAAVDAPFRRRVANALERYRMAGYDLEVDAPRYVALDIELHVCAAAGYFREQVQQAVFDVLAPGRRADGSPGYFAPQNFVFGQAVYLSPLVAAVQAVAGVASVVATRFQRLVAPSATSLADGVITMARLEVAQLANDPNYRERGRLVIDIGGGA